MVDKARTKTYFQPVLISCFLSNALFSAIDILNHKILPLSQTNSKSLNLLNPPLHICFVVHEYSEDFHSPEVLLEDYFTLTGWCEALVSAGCKVSVLARYNKQVYVQRTGVDYYFEKDEYGPTLYFWQVPKHLHSRIQHLNPDLVHTHNMNKVLQHWHLVRTLDKTIPVLIQNHAETPKYWLRSQVQRQVFKRVDGFLFCARGQENIWKEKGIMGTDAKINFAMEGSTDFQMMDRKVARQKTKMEGDPIFLWVGNLNPNKDPLTILAAFQRFLIKNPEAKLYMIYRFGDLLSEVQSLIGESVLLRKSVTLLGSKIRKELEAYYNSAEYFILGSHQEGSGYSLMEAMACGCVPVVTDIPSFRMMTNEGSIGKLWNPGDQASSLKAMDEALKLPLEDSGRAARAFFERELSYQGIVNKMIPCYQQLVDQARS